MLLEQERRLDVYKILNLFLFFLFWGRSCKGFCFQFHGCINKEKYPLKWKFLANLPPDGPSINCKIWRLFDTRLSKVEYKGFLLFVNCPIHIVHNAFHKGVSSNLYQEVDGFAFDLHAWFRHSPWKEEDFRNLSSSTANESQFL